MKINFIRNLSDDVLKENHQLKSNIVLLKQQATIFTNKMLTFLTNIQPNINIMNSAEQILDEFVNQINKKLKLCHQVKVINETNQIKMELQQTHIKKLQRLIFEKESAISIILKKQQSERADWNLKQHSIQEIKKKYQKRIDQLGKEIHSLAQTHKMDNLLSQQKYRKQMLQIRQFYNDQLIQLREKSKNQLMKLQTQLKSEIVSRQATIKQLQQSLQKLASSVKIDQIDNQVLRKLLKSFQQYNELTEIIKSLRLQNNTLYTKCQGFATDNIKTSSILQECKTIEQNLNSKIKRQQLQKEQLQFKIQQFQREIEKSQKQKDAMQIYYDRKWTSQYNKVKYQLEKTYIEKIQILEKQNLQRVQEMKQTIHKINQQTNQIKIRNQNLENIHRQDCIDKIVLKNQTEQLKNDILMKNKQAEENWKMSRQQIYSLKSQFYSQKKKLDEKVNQLNKIIKLYQNNFIQTEQKFKFTLKQMQNHFQQKANMLNQKNIQEKIDIQKKYQNYISKLQLQAKQNHLWIDQQRKVIQIEFNKKILLFQQSQKSKLKDKQDQCQKKIDKIMIKSKQNETKLIQLKKKHEQDHYFLQKHNSTLQKQIQNQANKFKQLESQIKNLMILKQQFIIKINDQQTTLDLKSQMLKQKQNQIKNLQNQLIQFQNQILKTKQNQFLWIQKLTELKKQYTRQFDCLKKINDKQVNIYKSKIWQLQEMSKKKILGKKDYQKIQNLHQQKQHLKDTIYIKQAQNLILNQVKDYYEAKLKVAEQKQKQKIQEKSFNTTHFIFSRKLTKKRKVSYCKQSMQHILQPKQMTEMKKYIKTSNKKYNNLSLSKTRYQNQSRYNRMYTAFN